MSGKKNTVEELLEEALVPQKEQPYKIPENWMWIRLKILNKNKNKKRNINPANFSEELFELYSVPSFSDGGPEYLTGGEIKSNKQLVDKDEILLCKINPRINRVWKVLSNKGEQRQLASTEWIVVNANEKIYPDYILYFLKSPYFRKLISSNVSGVGGSLTRAKPKEVENYPIAIPPFNEQKRIAEKVERFLNKIEDAKQLIQEAKETFELRRAAILDKAFRGELTKKWRKENNLDFNWEEKRLEDLIEYGPQNGLYKPQKAYGTGVLIVRIDNFYDGKINDWQTLKRLQLDSKEMELYGLKNRDLIINRVNSIEYLGKSALVRDLPEPCVFESNVMRLGLNDEVIPEYLILYLNSSKGLQELRKNAKHAVNQASINQQDVKNVLVPLPSKEEQEEIERLLDILFENEQSAMNHFDVLEKLEVLKKSTLAKAFRGELGTNDPSEESAIELLKEFLQEQIN
ncbi:restriction endonuclease subunit S [Priestia megaterium]|uniref:restriction endonuclease subunit S n=1 Tax=Priestia megaterium TaxID=1404 RepID=UPI0031FC5ACB